MSIARTYHVYYSVQTNGVAESFWDVSVGADVPELCIRSYDRMGPAGTMADLLNGSEEAHTLAVLEILGPECRARRG